MFKLSIYAIAGWFIVALFFTALFSIIAFVTGLKTAVITFLIGVSATVLIIFAVHLTSRGVNAD